MWHYSNISVETTLTASVSAGDTAIPIASTAGLPVSFPYTVVLDFGAANAEVVTVTNLAGSTLTVTRGEDGTTAQSHSLGARVVHAAVARDFREPQQHIAASGDVHGVGATAAVVGTTTPQTLTNKSISGAANTLTNVPAANLVGEATDFVTEASGINAVPLTVKAVSGQVADRARFEDDLGASPTRINAAGELVVDQIRTDGAMSIDGDVATTGDVSCAAIDSTGLATNRRTNTNLFSYWAGLDTDTEGRWAVRSDGLMEWGAGGVTSRDTNLYRSAANSLKTDDNFEVGGGTLVVGSRDITDELDRLRRAPVAVTNTSTLISDTEGTILTAQWDAEAGDNIRVAVSGQSVSNGQDRQLTIRLKEDGVTIATRVIGSPVSNFSFPFQAERIRTSLTSGTKTYTVTAQMSSFTGNVNDAELSIIPVGG